MPSVPAGVGRAVQRRGKIKDVVRYAIVGPAVVGLTTEHDGSWNRVVHHVRFFQLCLNQLGRLIYCLILYNDLLSYTSDMFLLQLPDVYFNMLPFSFNVQ